MGFASILMWLHVMAVRKFCPDWTGCLISLIADTCSCLRSRNTECLVDVCADAPAPSWEELESVMLAVKLVVHGLVEFIQNFSKKSHDAPQVTLMRKVVLFRIEKRETQGMRWAERNASDNRHYTWKKNCGKVQNKDDPAPARHCRRPSTWKIRCSGFSCTLGPSRLWHLR